MNGGMLVFHNGSNTSYANHSRNLTSMSSATTAITLRFLGQGASATATSTDAVVLTVTAGKEELVMEFLASVMANPQHSMQVFLTVVILVSERQLLTQWLRLLNHLELK